MRRLIYAAAVAISASAVAQNQGGGRVEDRALPTDRPERPAAVEGRQSNWIDEARPAGAEVSPPPSNPALSPSAPEIREYVAALINATLTPQSLEKATSMLCSTDRQRLSEGLKELDAAHHDEVLRAFRAQWKSRYGEEFDLKKQRAVTGEYFVMRGLRSAEEAIMVAHQSPATNGPAPEIRPEEHPQEPELAATMLIPPNTEQRQPAMILVLNNETTGGTNWRLNTPDSLSAKKLQQNLEERLGRFLDGRTAWPANVRDAYRVVTYQVLATFNDQPAERARESTPEQPRPSDRENPSLES